MFYNFLFQIYLLFIFKFNLYCIFPLVQIYVYIFSFTLTHVYKYECTFLLTGEITGYCVYSFGLPLFCFPNFYMH